MLGPHYNASPYTFDHKVRHDCVWLVKHEVFPHQILFGLAYQVKDIVFRFSIEYSSLRDFGP
jgi:hypothetical protein